MNESMNQYMKGSLYLCIREWLGTLLMVTSGDMDTLWFLKGQRSSNVFITNKLGIFYLSNRFVTDIRPVGYPDGYPAFLISGFRLAGYRISGCSIHKKVHIVSRIFGRISGRISIRCNPSIKSKYCGFCIEGR